MGYVQNFADFFGLKLYMAVATRVFLEVFLMVFLCWVKNLGGGDLRYDGIAENFPLLQKVA